MAIDSIASDGPPDGMCLALEFIATADADRLSALACHFLRRLGTVGPRSSERQFDFSYAFLPGFSHFRRIGLFAGQEKFSEFYVTTLDNERWLIEIYRPIGSEYPLLRQLTDWLLPLYPQTGTSSMPDVTEAQLGITKLPHAIQGIVRAYLDLREENDEMRDEVRPPFLDEVCRVIGLKEDAVRRRLKKAGFATYPKFRAFMETEYEP
jgi:hypothetical protein